MGMYERSVGHGGVMLLNQTPDPSGLIPATDVKRVKEFAQEIERRYGAPIVTSQGKGKTVIAQPSSPMVVDAVSIMEDIHFGERVRKYVVEGMVDGTWQTLAEGTAIGHKKIDKFDPIRVASVRLTVTESVGEPVIRQLAVFRTQR
jgi:alpha-L-fucosidase